MVAGERRGEGGLGSDSGFCSAEGMFGTNALVDLSVESSGLPVIALRRVQDDVVEGGSATDGAFEWTNCRFCTIVALERTK